MALSLKMFKHVVLTFISYCRNETRLHAQKKYCREHFPIHKLEWTLLLFVSLEWI